MELDLENGELCLRENAPIRLRRARGLRVLCTAGRIWLTDADGSGDVFLGPGQSHTIHGHGLVLLEGLRGGRVCLVPPSGHARPRVWQGPRAWLAGVLRAAPPPPGPRCGP